MKSQLTLSIKSLKNKTRINVYILISIQLLIALTVFAFYTYRRDFLSFPIDLSFAPNPSKSNDYYSYTINSPITSKENLLYKDIVSLIYIPFIYYLAGKVLFEIITRFGRQHPKAEKVDVEIHLLYLRSLWQHAGLFVSILCAVTIYEKIGFGSGLLSKDYIISNRGSWLTSCRTSVFIVFAIGYIAYHKRWKKMLACLPPTKE